VPNYWCQVDGREPNMDCWVRYDHLIIEEQLYADGSVIVRPATPMDEINYDGTPESRRLIHEWMCASALNPLTPFGYRGTLEDGSPGLRIGPGDTVYRVGGLFGVRGG
jgi:hypothetical protein